MPNPAAHDLFNLPKLRGKIKSKEASDAFCYMVGEALSNGLWTCKAYHSEPKDSFHYHVGETTSKYYFSFIVNQKDLLFYVREKGESLLGKVKVSELRAKFPCLEKNNSKDEIRIRIKTLDEAIKLVEFLFPKT